MASHAQCPERLLTICRDIFVEEERKEIIATAVGTWAFSAHDFTDDELLYGALLMLKHALKMPEVEEWGMTDGEYAKSLSDRSLIMLSVR